MKWVKVDNKDGQCLPQNTGRKFNVHKTSRRLPGGFNVLYAFDLGPMSRRS